MDGTKEAIKWSTFDHFEVEPGKVMGRVDAYEAVIRWVSGSSENRGLSIKSSSLSSPGFYAFYSREVSPDAGPRLYIEYS